MKKKTFEELEHFWCITLTLVYVSPVDFDVIVAVLARVLVVEAECVQQLVHDDPVFQAAWYPEGQALPLARVAHQWGAAANEVLIWLLRNLFMIKYLLEEKS